ncbi:hypothetical protein [Sphingobacterium sp. N143]|uniref:hypothetical protein n=1 Tax=Sphingobacterium sp. N143 TaxID=2746727 RepID=UPI0025788807|nr:hypothetical protein [Sphingobacterium sp. N143]
MEPQSNLLIYQSEDGVTRIKTRLEGETVWLTQAQMADIFKKVGRLLRSTSSIFLKREN